MSELVVRTSSPLKLFELLNPMAMLRNLWSHRELIRRFAVREVMQQYKGTNLGLLWAVAQPLLTLGVYTFVFTTIFPSKWERFAGEGGPSEAGSFALNFFAGYVLYNFFSRTVATSPSIITRKPNLVRKVVFPVEVLPVVDLGSDLLFVFIGCSLLVTASVIFAGTISATLPLILLVMVPLVMITLGVSWVVAALGVFVRDIQQAVGVMVHLLFFMTPIFYPLSGVPESVRPIVAFNPLTPIVTNGRKVLLLSEYPDWTWLAVSTFVSFFVMLGGYAFFQKCKRGFADVL